MGSVCWCTLLDLTLLALTSLLTFFQVLNLKNAQAQKPILTELPNSMLQEFSKMLKNQFVICHDCSALPRQGVGSSLASLHLLLGILGRRSVIACRKSIGKLLTRSGVGWDRCHFKGGPWKNTFKLSKINTHRCWGGACVPGDCNRSGNTLPTYYY